MSKKETSKKEAKRLPYIHSEQRSSVDIVGAIRKNRRLKQMDRTFLIFMFMRNGDARIEWVTTTEDTFELLGGSYLIDMTCAKYEPHNRSYMLIYHQDISLPLSIDINVPEFYDRIHQMTGTDVSTIDINTVDVKKLATESQYLTYNIIPSVLNHLINADVIKKIIQGESITELLSMVKYVMIYTAIAASVSAMSGIIIIFIASG